jgi:hypothetical protein
MNRVISRIRRPATILVAVIFAVGFAFAQRRSVGDDEKAVRDVLMRGATSFEKNDTAEATKVWVNDESLTVFESGHANYGWTDYRDHHLFPEMRECKTPSTSLTT